jgi:thymidylate synthase ThyX
MNTSIPKAIAKDQKVEAISTTRKEHPHKYDSSSQIFVFDDFHPEDNAMLQALYSRSPRSVMEHVDKVRGADSGTFMEKFYVGYGHLSIADCGTTTLFIENVSILAAKAFQDWQLYNGQEASTRYLDYSKQKIINPIGTPEAAAIQQKWMDFYNSSMEPLMEDLKKRYPIKEGEKESIYIKAIAARSFDILRGFLPAGCTTYLSWHTNLRQAHEKLALLEHHPLEEMRSLSVRSRETLMTKYKHSFSHKKYQTQEEYNQNWSADYTYFNPAEHPDFAFENHLDLKGLSAYNDLLSSRPIKTNLPAFLGMYGQCTFKFLLDFGSFRDIQRHRNGECLMPLLTTKFGFYQWYLDQLTPELKAKAEALITELEVQINQLPTTDFIRQYYLPLGYSVPVTVTYKLPASVYVAELRSGITVHPTLRIRAQQMGQALQQNVPNLAMHLDLSESDWDLKRGNQDIVKKD